MPFEKQEHLSLSPTVKAKQLLSNGDNVRAFSVLIEGKESGNVMALLDLGFLMIQGIGCKKDMKEGMKTMKEGFELAKLWEDDGWKQDESLTSLFSGVKMCLYGLFQS